MPYSLKSRRLLITAGSRGLGAEVVRRFAAEGCDVAINYHENTAAAEELRGEVEAKYGVRAVILKGVSFFLFCRLSMALCRGKKGWRD